MAWAVLKSRDANSQLTRLLTAERMLALNKLSGVDDLAQILYGAMTTAHLAGLAGEEDSDAGK